MAAAKVSLRAAISEACAALSIDAPNISDEDELGMPEAATVAVVGVLRACMASIASAPKVLGAQRESYPVSESSNPSVSPSLASSDAGAVPAAESDRVVSINVGGRVFTTLYGTLTRFSGSRLEAMTSGRWRVPRDEAGRLFVDRRPDRFDVVLDFLRDPAAGICPGDGMDREAVAEELDWWGLLEHAYPAPLAQSTILSAAQRRDVYHMLDGTRWQGEGWRLCYRASRDGLSASAFHRCCDAVQPSLVVTRSTLGTTFGGLYDGTWRSVEGHNLSKSRSFLFVLETLRGPCSIKCFAGADPAGRPVVWQDARYGPVFGIYDDPDGHSRNGLALIHRESDKLGFVTLGVPNCCFESPEGWQDSRLLTGSANGSFTIDDIEVFACASQADLDDAAAGGRSTDEAEVTHAAAAGSSGTG